MKKIIYFSSFIILYITCIIFAPFIGKCLAETPYSNTNIYVESVNENTYNLYNKYCDYGGKVYTKYDENKGSYYEELCNNKVKVYCKISTVNEYKEIKLNYVSGILIDNYNKNEIENIIKTVDKKCKIDLMINDYTNYYSSKKIDKYIYNNIINEKVDKKINCTFYIDDISDYENNYKKYYKYKVEYLKKYEMIHECLIYENEQ